MDKYLDNRYRSGSAGAGQHGQQAGQAGDENDPAGGGTLGKKSHVIKLSDPSSKRSRCTSPNDGTQQQQQPQHSTPFSYLYSGRDDLQTASASSLRDRQSVSPYQHLLRQEGQQAQQPSYQRGSSLTQSYNRYPSPSNVNNQSPSSRYQPPPQQQQQQQQQRPVSTGARPRPSQPQQVRVQDPALASEGTYKLLYFFLFLNAHQTVCLAL
jgi:hypothetical protein